MRVADYIIACVYDKLQTDTIFLLPGGGSMHLTDAIACHGKMNYVCSYNEQATTMEADGFAKIKGGFGVALVTSGPGATNAITGVVGAWQDSSRVMVISGQSKKNQTIAGSGQPGLRQLGVQEVNIIPMVSSVTKYAAMIDEPQKARYHFEKAVFLAKHGRPGPVWLDIPLDVQGAVIEPELLEGFDPVREGFIKPEDTAQKGFAVRGIIKRVNEAERPVIIAGQGVRIAGAVKNFNELVEKLRIPVVTPRLGIDLMGGDHPLYVGRFGIKGDRAANFAVQNADLVLCVGSRLSINVTGHEYGMFAREARVIVVDIDEFEHRKRTVRIDEFIKCDALEFIEALIDNLGPEEIEHAKERKWPCMCRAWKKKYPVVLEEYKSQTPINTYYFTDVLSGMMSPEDILVIDSGTSSYVVQQSIKIKYGQRLIASGGLGAMGYAVPAAIGACFAAGDKQVICVTGDGSLHMNNMELQTLSYKRLPIKIFVYDNRGFASMKATQRNYFKSRFIGVDKDSGVFIPEVLKIAELYNIKCVKIENTDDLAGNIGEVLSFNGPVICDVVCSPDQRIIPTVYSIKKEDGTMVSLPLEDMFPFLDREEFRREMIVKPLETEL